MAYYYFIDYYIDFIDYYIDFVDYCIHFIDYYIHFIDYYIHFIDYYIAYCIDYIDCFDYHIGQAKWSNDGVDMMKSDDLVGGVWWPMDGSGSPTDLTMALMRGVTKGGIRLGFWRVGYGLYPRAYKEPISLILRTTHFVKLRFAKNPRLGF